MRAYGANRFGDLSTVTVHVQRLRKKLHRPGAAPLIETVPRVGYRAPAAADRAMPAAQPASRFGRVV